MGGFNDFIRFIKIGGELTGNYLKKGNPFQGTSMEKMTGGKFGELSNRAKNIQLGISGAALAAYGGLSALGAKAASGAAPTAAAPTVASSASAAPAAVAAKPTASSALKQYLIKAAISKAMQGGNAGQQQQQQLPPEEPWYSKYNKRKFPYLNRTL